MKKRLFLDGPYHNPYITNRRTFTTKKKGLFLLLLFLTGLISGLYWGNSDRFKQYSQQLNSAYFEYSEFAAPFVAYLSEQYKKVTGPKPNESLTIPEISAEALLFPIEANAAHGEPIVLLIPIWTVIKQINELN